MEYFHYFVLCLKKLKSPKIEEAESNAPAF